MSQHQHQHDHGNSRRTNLTTAAVIGGMSGLVRAIFDWIIEHLTRNI